MRMLRKVCLITMIVGWPGLGEFEISFRDTSVCVCVCVAWRRFIGKRCTPKKGLSPREGGHLRAFLGLR